MKHTIRLVSVLSLLIFIVPVGSSGSTLGKSYLLFGINEYYYNYEEFAPPFVNTPTFIYNNPPSILDREYGATSAIHLEGKVYSRDPSLPLYCGFLFEYGGGIQTYIGGPLYDTEVNVPSPGVTTEFFPPDTMIKTNTFTRIGGFVGPYFKLGNCLLGFNAGLLYYSWFRGVSAYNEIYTWIYLPIGAEIQCKLNDQVCVGLDLQYRIMLSNSMQALGDGETVVLYNPTPSQQYVDSTRDGFYLGIPIQLQINKGFGIEWKPWFELRPSGATINAIPGELYEPDSYAYSIGMSISAMFGKFSALDRSH